MPKNPKLTMDYHHFNFTQYYFMVFAFNVPKGYEHCNELWNKYLKHIEQFNINNPEYPVNFENKDDDSFCQEEMYDFLKMEEDILCKELEAQWAVGDMLSEIKGIIRSNSIS